MLLKGLMLQSMTIPQYSFTVVLLAPSIGCTSHYCSSEHHSGKALTCAFQDFYVNYLLIELPYREENGLYF